MSLPSYATIRSSRRSRVDLLRRVTPEDEPCSSLLPPTAAETGVGPRVPDEETRRGYGKEIEELRVRIAKRRREGANMVWEEGGEGAFREGGRVPSQELEVLEEEEGGRRERVRYPNGRQCTNW